MLNKIKHWTPRYMYNRAAVLLQEKIYKDRPWLTKDSIMILDNILNKKDVGLEFGSGRSTKWFASRVGRLISIENDSKWFQFVKESLGRHSISNVDYRLKSETEYVSVINELDDRSIDFSLVDGIRREDCALGILPKIKNGGFLIIDNINWFVPSKTLSPASMKGNNYFNGKWRDFWSTVENKRKIWTSNGVTDTLIILI